MRVLITGGAGFIGSHLVQACLERGDEVAVLDNLSTGRRSQLFGPALFYEVDLRDREDVYQVLEEVRPQVVFHLAAQMSVTVSTREPERDAEENILGSLHLLKAALHYGVNRVVYASTGGAVYGKPAYLPVDEAHPICPLSEYGISKHTVEHYLDLYERRYGMKATILRYPNVYGPRQRPDGEAGVVAIFARQLLQGEQPVIYGDGSKTRDYVYIDDLVRAHFLALETPDRGIYNLGSAQETTDLQVYETVRRAVGRKQQPEFQPVRTGEVRRICLDSRKALRELGWFPEVPFQTGVENTVAWLREKLYG